MKKVFSFVIVLITLVPLGAQTLLDKAVATVNLIKPEMISQRQLTKQHEQLEELALQGGGDLASLDKRNVLDLMIAEILIGQGMERDGISVSPREIEEAVAQQKAAVEQQNNVALTDREFREAIERQMQLPWDSYEDQVGLQLKQQKYLLKVKPNILSRGETPPSYKEISTFYKKNRSQFTNPDLLRYSHIFIAARNLSGEEQQKALGRAEDAYRKLQNGGVFEALVVEYSDDDRSRYKGGDGGFLAINDPRPVEMFGEDFVDALFSMAPGDVSRVLQSQMGYHIVKLTEYHEAKILDLTDQVTPDNSVTVQEYIAQALMAQNQQKALKDALDELVEELRSAAEIKVFEENIK